MSRRVTRWQRQTALAGGATLIVAALVVLGFLTDTIPDDLLQDQAHEIDDLDRTPAHGVQANG